MTGGKGAKGKVTLCSIEGMADTRARRGLFGSRLLKRTCVRWLQALETNCYCLRY